ncbi:hypothetical protein D3C77_588600 [compost metagenome]
MEQVQGKAGVADQHHGLGQLDARQAMHQRQEPEHRRNAPVAGAPKHGVQCVAERHVGQAGNTQCHQRPAAAGGQAGGAPGGRTRIHGITPHAEDEFEENLVRVKGRDHRFERQ